MLPVCHPNVRFQKDWMHQDPQSVQFAWACQGLARIARMEPALEAVLSPWEVGLCFT